MAYARDAVAAANIPIVPYTDPEATHLVLPLPAFDRAGHISGGPTVNELLPYIPGKTVLGGKLGVQGEYLLGRAARVIDYFSDEALTAGNADITAEGAIQLAMDRLPVTLTGAPVLVIGWGRIGQLLARKLQALGAEVTVSARKDRDLGMIGALGLRPEKTGLYSHGLTRYRVIFNTVPAMILSPEQAAQIPPRCLYVELASQPGVDPSLLLPEQFLPGGGLPGKTSPDSAGILIGRTILRLTHEESKTGGVQIG